jgi:hypothetical protein
VGSSWQVFRSRCGSSTATPLPPWRSPFGDLLTYCTDTAYDEANAELARGSRVLAHDASSTEASRGAIGTHSSAREAATVAGRADVEHLVLIHIQPYSRRTHGSAEPHCGIDRRSSPTRNLILHRLLEMSQTRPPDYTVLLDNGSRDGSAQAIRNAYPNVSVVRDQ